MDSKFNESFLTQVLLQIAPKMIFVDEESKDGVEGNFQIRSKSLYIYVYTYISYRRS